MINSYIASKTHIGVYKAWLSLYIVGDRAKSDVLFNTFRELLEHYANEFNKDYAFEKKPLYRGLLLPPNYDMKSHNIWKYSHVSFTEDSEVAKTFSDINSQYGFVFPRHYIGKILNYNIEKDDIIWFHHSWSKHMDDPLFDKFVTFWNQKEIIIGKK
jgi:hypothetical protein